MARPKIGSGDLPGHREGAERDPRRLLSEIRLRRRLVVTVAAVIAVLVIAGVALALHAGSWITSPIASASSVSQSGLVVEAVVEGGPPPPPKASFPTSQSVTVTVSTSGTVVLRLTLKSDVRVRVLLPTGTFTISGADGNAPCSGTTTIPIRAGQFTSLTLTCAIR